MMRRRMLTGNIYFFSRKQSSFLRVSRKWGRCYVSQRSQMRTSRRTFWGCCERKGGGRDELLLMSDEPFYYRCSCCFNVVNVVNVMETSCLFTNEKRRIEIFFSFKWMCFFVVKIEKQLLSLLSNLLHLSSSLFSVSNFSLSLSLFTLSSPSLHPLYVYKWMIRIIIYFL